MSGPALRLAGHHDSNRLANAMCTAPRERLAASFNGSTLRDPAKNERAPQRPFGERANER
jgi:hypothetical protein